MAVFLFVIAGTSLISALIFLIVAALILPRKRMDAGEGRPKQKRSHDGQASTGAPLETEEGKVHRKVKGRGLYQKYIVRYATGKEVDGCFVLRPAHDRAAWRALWMYAGDTPNRALRSDLIAWLCDIEEEGE